MKKSFYYLLTVFLVFATCSRVSAQTFPPSFIGGHVQSLSLCQNSGIDPINSLLAISDLTTGATEVWSVSYGASHGTLIAGYSTPSTGGIITPTGLSYTPAFGYAGTDSFQVMISNGTYVDMTTIYVTVNASPAAITGTPAVCPGMTITLNDATTGGSWSSSTTGIATASVTAPGVGTIGGVSAGTATISYILPDGCSARTTVTVNPLPSVITGNARVCAGSTSTLSDSASGGTWSSSITSYATVDPSSGLLTGVSVGLSTITYTLPTGCRITRVATVNVTPAAITGTDMVCSNSTTSLSDASTGGAWTSSDNTVATVSGTGVVTGVSAGTATITFGLPTGCMATTVVTVNLTPAAIAGPSSVCISSTITLTDATPGGVWSNTSVHATLDATGDVSGVSTGPATITYTLGSCFTTKAIVVNPISPVTGTGAICPGSTLILSDAAGGGTWSSSAPGIASVTTSGSGVGIVTAISAGTSTITYLMPTGCLATTDVTINPLPSPISGTISICSGLAAALFEPTPGGTWSSSAPGIASITPSSDIYTGVSAGTANITYTLSTGCRTTRIVTVFPTPAAISGTAVVCAGSTTTLTDPTVGGVWSSSNTTIATVNSSTGLTSGLSAGLVTITYTIEGACIATRDVTVNTTGAAITGPSSVCISSSISLSDPTPGGTWSSSSPHVMVVAGSGMITGVSTGPATITYAIGSCFATTSVAVNPIYPIATTGNACVGNSFSLTDGATGGTWSSSATSVATATTLGLTLGSVTGVSAGTSIVTYLMPTGCFATTVITINPIPAAIAGTASACAGAASLLTDASGGGVWAAAPTTIATISATGNVSAVSAGMAVITYTLGTGCRTMRTFTVNPQPAPLTGPDSVCAGASITLSDAVSGGTWSSSSDSIATVISSSYSTGVVTGVNPGVTTITFTMLGGCFVTKPVIVDVTPTPILGSATMCQGSTMVLSDSTAGGIWTSSNTMAAVGSASGIVTGVMAGGPTISYTIGACSVTKTIAIFAISPITGPDSLCKGAISYLYDATGGGDWTSGTTSVATISTVATIGYGEGMVSGVSAGTATISYNMPSGCVVTQVITVNPLPAAITGPDAVCQYATVTLGDASGGGVWTTAQDTIAMATPATGAITGVSGGLAKITYTLPTGCATTRYLTVNPAPSGIFGDSVLCLGVLSTRHSAMGGKWYSADPAIASVDSLVGNFDFGVSIGTTTFTYVLATGCSFTTTITVKDCHLGVNELTGNLSGIEIIPNPNRGAFVISGEMAASATGVYEPVDVILTDVLGRTVYSDKVTPVNGMIHKEVMLNGNITSGSYILNLRTDSERRAFHVVIQQ